MSLSDVAESLLNFRRSILYKEKQVSAVADDPARRAASRSSYLTQLAKVVSRTK